MKITEVRKLNYELIQGTDSTEYSCISMRHYPLTDDVMTEVSMKIAEKRGLIKADNGGEDTE